MSWLVFCEGVVLLLEGQLEPPTVLAYACKIVQQHLSLPGPMVFLEPSACLHSMQIELSKLQKTFLVLVIAYSGETLQPRSFADHRTATSCNLPHT
jgi:hypothetical protein